MGSIKNTSRGFTLIEFIMVMVIFSIMIIVITRGAGNFQTSSQGQDAVTQITQMLRIAREQSMARLHNTTHGVYFNNSSAPYSVTLFEGPSYAGRTTDYDRVYTMDAGLVFTSISAADNTILFSLGKGYPTSGVEERITFQHNASGIIYNITIMPKGMVSW